MQDIPSIGAGGGTLFNGSGGCGGGGVGGGGGDRRLRPHNNHQALKCPRCDSLNTKFCYYNNYNLSQPRHFCKSCRRYWTKGGVLRNVPVGGGCRKAKRSKHKHANAATETTAIGDTTTAPGPSGSELKSSNSHSSSESSSLTATTNTNASTTAMEALSGHSSIDPKSVFQANNHDMGIFSDIGSFTSLISTTNRQLQFGFDSILMNQQVHDLENQQWQQSQQEAVAMSGGGLVDQTVEVRSTGNEGFGPLDWQGTNNVDHQGLFDLPNTVDHVYWSQHQWDGQDQSGLY